ncbi:MAG: HDOD domain-containing protein [Bdellovibrionota bacterium]
MSLNSRSSSLSKASLAKAAQQLSLAWFPANPQIVDLVRHRFQESYYVDRRELLIEDLRSDCSLYLYCIRELLTLLRDTRKEGDRGVSHQELSTLLVDASLEQIEEALALGRKNISVHSLKSMSESQAERLEESLLSVSTAELLAEKVGLSATLGFNAALLRQLGLTLIAWNYPNVYRQALDAVCEGRDELNLELDSAIHSSVGFSPGMLGMKLAQLWGLADNVADVIGANATLEKAQSSEAVRGAGDGQSRALLHICAVGEAFARANNPERYPTARADWRVAEAVIKSHLGPEGVRSIQSKALQLRGPYASQLPALFRLSDFETERTESQDGQPSGSAYEANVFLKACSRPIRDKFWPVYEKLGETVSGELLREFAHSLLPSLGFDVSCYFVVDPARGELCPALKVGNPSFVRAKAVSMTDPKSALNPVRVALHRKAPISGQGIVGQADKTFYVGSIGVDHGVGVIYAELSPQASADVRKNPTMVFQALRRCLNDLLLLRPEES